MAGLRQQASAKTSIGRIKDIIDSNEFSTMDIASLQTNGELLEQYFGKYQTAHDTLVRAAMDDDEVKVLDDALAVVESNYSGCKSAINRRKGVLQREAATTSNTSNSDENATRCTQREETRLKPVSVKKFNGEPEKWITFYSSFNEMVHSKTCYKPVEKFHYLRDSLGENALRVIGGLTVSGDLYEEAWNTLVKRFENKRFLVNSHLKVFFDHRLPNTPTSSDILHLVDVTNDLTRSLGGGALKLPVDQWDAILVFIMVTKLDEATRQAWELEQDTNDLPTLQSLLDYLERRTRSLCVAQSSQATTKQNKRMVSNAVATTTATLSCALCQNSHALYACPTFLGTAVENRFGLIKSLNVCYNCLRKRHKNGEACTSSNCKHCNKRHNSALCRTLIGNSATASTVSGEETNSSVPNGMQSNNS